MGGIRKPWRRTFEILGQIFNWELVMENEKNCLFIVKLISDQSNTNGLVEVVLTTAGRSCIGIFDVYLFKVILVVPITSPDDP